MKVRLTPAMMRKMVQITVEILDILATATKEMEQSRGSKLELLFTWPETNPDSEKFLKRVVGWTDLEDGLKRLDKLIYEEIAMANAEQLNITCNIDNRVTEVDQVVRRVDENVLAVQSQVEIVNDNIQVVDDKVQTMADGWQYLFGVSSTLSLIFIIQTAWQPQRK